MLSFGSLVKHWPADSRLAGNNKLKLQDTFAATNAGHAGAHGFQDGTAIKCANEGFDLVLVAGELYGVDLIGDIDNASPKDIGNALHLVAFLAYGTNLDKPALAFDEIGSEPGRARVCQYV